MYGCESVAVRPAVITELPQILALDREISFEHFKPLFLQYPDRSIGKNADHILEQELEYDEVAFTQAINDTTHQQKLYVAYGDHAIIGFANFQCNNASVIIDLLCIDKKYRGKGVGKQMANQILQLPDVTSFRLAVIEKNKGARMFWKSIGFNLLNEKPSDMGNDFPTDCADIYQYYEYRK